MRAPRRFTPGYLGVLGAAFALAVGAGWLPLASRMDRDAYDFMSRAEAPPAGPPRSVVVAFDERTLAATGGMRKLRTTLAQVLEAVNKAQPAVVAIDILLSEPGDDLEDRRLASVLRETPNLILASDLVPETGAWEDPVPLFRKAARAVGHVHAAPDPVSRVLPLELIGTTGSSPDRRWAMALEAARLRDNAPLTESPTDLELGSTAIPAARRTSRALYIRYREDIPAVPAVSLIANGADAAPLRHQAVFIGITAQTAARDRLVTPLDRMMSGVEIHAQAFETIINGSFLRLASPTLTVAICFVLVALPGCGFALLTGWQAYLAGGAAVLLAHVLPHFAFRRGIVLSYLATVFAAWLSAISAAAWQYFVVRRQLRRSESDKKRYQQAIHFVTHEMRSPLTAIQGSSELMGRYNLSEEKRRQMAQMINNESKRLARMIQTFLDIERLTDGETEIRSEPFDLTEVLRSCAERAEVLAERKQILISVEASDNTWKLRGDRELMEYAVYNLLTNAIKYSPAGTKVTVLTSGKEGEVRVSVTDEGMGMDDKELRNIGRKFYRTRRAEASGEAGTGIGLSLVQQIVTHHHGRLEVESTPGAGSCFTMVLPATAV